MGQLTTSDFTAAYFILLLQGSFGAPTLKEIRTESAADLRQLSQALLVDGMRSMDPLVSRQRLN